MSISDANAGEEAEMVLPKDRLRRRNGEISVEDNIVEFFNKRAKEIAEEEKIALEEAKEMLAEKFSPNRIDDILKIEKAAKKKKHNISQCSDCGMVFNGKEFVEISKEEKKYLKGRGFFFSQGYCKSCVKNIRRNLRKRQIY